tara:strand:- start:2166 stop:2900 length:735 start_codon:yes stop_codon:yes gene_type:complete
MLFSDRLNGKTALVTGATRGLGNALAQEYAKWGCNLIIVGRDATALEATRTEVKELNPDVKVGLVKCDLSSATQVLEMAQNITNAVKGVDILVNCAGVFPVGEIASMSLEEYRECMEVNLTAPFILIKELSRNMISNGWGRIINVASSSAYGAAPTTSVYCASKHAMLGLSRSLFKELKPHNVRVLCVSPGSIQTDMGREVEKLGQDFQTFMTPHEVSEYIVYNTSLDGNLVSEEIKLNRLHIQ